MSSLHSTLIPLNNTRDSFRKVVILDGNARPWTDEDGVNYMGVIPFLTLTMIHPSRVRAEASPSISGLSFSCWGVL